MPILKLYKKSDVLRNVSALASGVLLAQIITLASSPILTRLYGPESFAIFALFTAFLGSVSPGICGRYDVAQVVVKSKWERDVLFSLAIWISWSLSLLMFIAVLLFGNAILEYFGAEDLGKQVLVFPFGLAAFATVYTLRYYANSETRFGLIGKMSVVQAVAAALAAVFLAMFGEHGILLIYATALGYLTGAGYLFAKMYKGLSRVRFWPSRLHCRIAVKYWQFPVFNASTSFLDGITLSMPVFFLLRDYPDAVVGYYSLLLRVATAPIGFLSTAVAQVHLRRIAELVHRAEPALGYLWRTTFALAGIITVFGLILMVWGPAIFALVFGEDWREAGVLLQILMPAVAVKFVVSTLSGVFSGTGNNKLGAAWRVGAFATTLAVYQFFSGTLDVRGFFLLMVTVDLFLYAIHYGLIVYAVRFPRKAS